jgi:hypothetical protein
VSLEENRKEGSLALTHRTDVVHVNVNAPEEAIIIHQQHSFAVSFSRPSP